MSEYHVFTGSDGMRIESNTRSTDQMARAFAASEAEKAPKTATPAATEPEKPEVESEATETEPEAPEVTTEAKDGEEKPAETGKDKKLGKPRHDPKARIDQLTRELRSMERERDEFKAKFISKPDEIESRANAAKQALESVKPATRPKLEDFEGVEEWGEALTKWTIAEDRKNQAEEAKQAKFKADQDAKLKTFSNKMQAHLEKSPDWFDTVSDDVVGWRPLSALRSDEFVKPENVIAEHFLVSEDPVALIEYLSGKPEEIQRLSTLHPLQLTAALGRIEERLAAANPTATVEEPSVSKAAPPARPVTGGPPTKSADPSKMSFEDYAKWQAAEDKKAGKSFR